MRNDLETTRTQTNVNESETHEYEIDKESAAHIMNMLRKDTYSKPRLAVVREYVTNAIDAHAEKGVSDTPIDLHLPTISEPYFAVRDYGPGMDPELIRQFTSYGWSGKRDNNTQIGAFGIGGKAGFAYSDSWTITTYCQGKKYVYSNYKNEKGTGTCTLIAKTTTTETGVKIRVPVPSQDVYLFRTTAKQFLKFLTVPLQSNIPIDILERLEDTELYSLIYKETHFQNQLLIETGHIVYPININEAGLEDHPVTKCFKSDRNHRLILKLPIGTCNITNSREELRYTDKTKRNLQVAFNKFMTTYTENFVGILKGLEGMERRRKYADLQEVHGSLMGLVVNSMIRQLIIKNINELKSKPTLVIPTEKKSNENILLFKLMRTANSQSKKPQLIDTTELAVDKFDDDWVIMIVDDKYCYRQKAAVHYDNKVYFLYPEQEKRKNIEATIEKFINTNNLQGLDEYIVWASELKRPNRNQVKSNSKTHTGKILKFEPSRFYHGRSKSKHWTEIDLDPSKTYYYVELERYRPQIESIHKHSLYGVFPLISQWNKMIDEPLLGIKTNVRNPPEIPKNCLPLVDNIIKILEKHFGKETIEAYVMFETLRGKVDFIPPGLSHAKRQGCLESFDDLNKLFDWYKQRKQIFNKYRKRNDDHSYELESIFKSFPVHTWESFQDHYKTSVLPKPLDIEIPLSIKRILTSSIASTQQVKIALLAYKAYQQLETSCPESPLLELTTA